MQLTIDIPDTLAEKLGPERDRVAAIIARGLRRSWSGTSALRREVISFLARRPTSEEILKFRPSGTAIDRSRELLRRNQQGQLTSDEEAELDEMGDVDRFISLIKAEVFSKTSGGA